MGLETSTWLLLVTTDAKLVGQLMQRGGVGLNITWLSVGAAAPTLDALNPLADDLRREVKVADGPPVVWNHGRQQPLCHVVVRGSHCFCISMSIVIDMSQWVAIPSRWGNSDVQQCDAPIRCVCRQSGTG